MTASSDEQHNLDRLSRISTHWTGLLQAHRASRPGRFAAQEAALLRYRGAVFRVLLGATRDADAAEELAQEFAVRFLQGDYHRVDPERGRFRDYLKTVLIRLVNQYHKASYESPRQFGPGETEQIPAAESNGSGLSFEACVRDELMEQTWSALHRDNERYHVVLLAHVRNPECTSRQAAEKLTGQFETPLTPSGIRKTLQRARTRFADLLVEQFMQMTEDDSPDALRRELKELDLLKYCVGALERRA